MKVSDRLVWWRSKERKSESRRQRLKKGEEKKVRKKRWEKGDQVQVAGGRKEKPVKRCSWQLEEEGSTAGSWRRPWHVIEGNGLNVDFLTKH